MRVYRAMRVLAWLWCGGCVAGAIILVVPEGEKRPLVPRTGWEASGGFSETPRPAAGMAGDFARRDDLIFWRSGSPGSGSDPGLLRSPPFAVPRFLAVPIVGHPARRGLSVTLECLDNGKTLPLVGGNPHEEWVDRTLWLPPHWCASRARLVAVAEPSRFYVGAGSPRESSFPSWLKESVFVVVFVHALCAGLLLLPGLALACLLERDPGDPRTWVLWVVPGTLLAGYGSFFLSYYAPSLGRWFGVGLEGAAVLVLLRHRGWWSRRPGGAPLAVIGWLGLSLFCLLGLYAKDLGAGPWSANYRFSPAVWASDNQLSAIVAENLYRDRPIVGIFGYWKTADRPPLLSGSFTLVRPLWEVVLGMGENRRLTHCFYQAAGTLLSCFWLVPAWSLLSSVGLGRGPTALAVALSATAGFTFFNSVYCWPKLLAGALALGAYLLLVEAPAQEGRRITLGEMLQASVLASLALLAHGGVVFGLPPVALLTLLPRRRPPWTAFVRAGLAAATLLLPWTLWQRVEDLPGNALVKFAFAGTWGFGEEDKGVVETVGEAYRRLSWEEWWETRGQALQSLVGRFYHPLLPRFPDSDALGRLRLEDFLFVLSSLRWLNLAWAAWLLVLLRRSRHPAGSPARRVALATGVGLCGLGLNLLVTFSVHIVHTQSYLSMLLIVLGLSGLVASAPPVLRTALAALHFSYFGLVWVLSPLGEGPVRADVLGGWGLLAAGLAMLLVGKERADSALPWP